MKALIGALERGAAESLGAWRFAPLNQNVENMYLDWIRQDVALDELAGADDETAGEVAASNPLPSATPSRLVRPLVYTLFVRRKSVLPSTHRVNLLLHDALGDHLTDMSSVALYQRYLQNAAGIICLINPLTIPPLAERLPGYLQQTVDPGNDARRTINRLIDSIQRDPHRGSADRIQVPCAVAFDPSDLLRFVLPHLGRDAHLLQDSDYATGIPVEDLQQVSQAVQDLLRQLAPSLVSQLQNSFATVAFFATSSGGRNGRGAPRRCLDPLAWLLWQMQVVQPASRRDVDVPPSH